MVSTEIQRQLETFRTEEHEVQNADFFYQAFEKSLKMFEIVPEGTKEQVHYSRILDSNFMSLQTQLCIFNCPECNEAHVNEMIVEKRKQLLKKLERKMRRLTNPRAVELAGIMQRMLRDNEKEFLTHDHIEPRDFTLSPDLVVGPWIPD